MKHALSAFILSFLLPAFLQAAAPASAQVVVYKSDACSHCTMYLSTLYDALQQAGYANVVQKDFLNDPQVRVELEQLQEQNGVPLTMRGHMVVSVGGSYLFEGHVPPEKVVSFLQNEAAKTGRILVFQDSMGDTWETFAVRDANGAIAQFGRAEPIPAFVQAGSSPVGFGPVPLNADFSKLVLPALIIIVPFGLVLVFGRK
jgi:hypothetical protein